jgi:hypothetical protein
MYCRALRHPLIIQLEPGGILKLREKGARRWYSIGLEALYKRFVAADVMEEKSNKKKEV